MVLTGRKVPLIITLMAFYGVKRAKRLKELQKYLKYNEILTEYVCINLLYPLSIGNVCAVISDWDQTSYLFSSVEKP